MITNKSFELIESALAAIRLEVEVIEEENERLRQLLKDLIGWIPSADTYRRLGFDPEATMRAYEEAKTALSKKVARQKRNVTGPK